MPMGEGEPRDHGCRERGGGAAPRAAQPAGVFGRSGTNSNDARTRSRWLLHPRHIPRRALGARRPTTTNVRAAQRNHTPSRFIMRRATRWPPALAPASTPVRTVATRSATARSSRVRPIGPSSCGSCAPRRVTRSRAAAESHRRCQPVVVSPVRRAALSAGAARRSRCSSRVFSATLGVSIGLLLALTSHDATLAHTGARATTTSAHPPESRDHGSIRKRAPRRSPVVTPAALAAD